MKILAAHISRLRCYHGTPLSVRFQAVGLRGNGAIFIIYIKLDTYFNKLRWTLVALTRNRICTKTYSFSYVIGLASYLKVRFSSSKNPFSRVETSVCTSLSDGRIMTKKLGVRLKQFKNCLSKGIRSGSITTWFVKNNHLPTTAGDALLRSDISNMSVIASASGMISPFMRQSFLLSSNKVLRFSIQAESTGPSNTIHLRSSTV